MTRGENFFALRGSRGRVRETLKSPALLAALIALSLGAAANSRDAKPQNAEPGLTAHEWGTFTSVAGNDGAAVEWSPLSSPGDLPGFVEHLRKMNFKLGLRGTVRMETPVLYFYSPQDATVSVHVSFSQGYITEWYPHAKSVAPAPQISAPGFASGVKDGSITWDSVALVPGSADELPREPRDAPYYAARETGSTPLAVKSPGGDEHEKFLFYRGVSSFDVPIAVRNVPTNRVLVRNGGGQAIPAAILFERRGGKVGYRVLSPMPDSAVIEPPELSGSVASLGREFEAILVAQGLFPDEAHAMLETWRDSWFEQGTRLFYIVPKPIVDSVLPLSIAPEPAEKVRVFVGRMEIVTRATQAEVTQAILENDGETLEKYHRFLEPFLNVIVERETDPQTVAQLQEYQQKIFMQLFSQNR